jgi:hypothetical protein
MLKICLWIVIFFLSFIPPIEAAACRTIQDQAICIVDIKRSAKNYWEYRVTLSINQMIQPVEIYNCRDRQIIKSDKTRVKFSSQDLSQSICRLYKP